MLYDLISHAIKYKSLDRDPEIVIGSAVLSHFLVVTMQDKGMGMPADTLSSIFTLYQRLGQQVEGQGIGLYLVRKTIDAAGGKVEVESEVGKGTFFKLFFRVASPLPQALLPTRVSAERCSP